MTELLAALLPVGSLALGSVLTMLNQGLSDRRTRRRESTARRDQLRIQLYESDREILHQLQRNTLDQQLLYANINAKWSCSRSTTHNLAPEETLEEVRLGAEQLPIFFRCRSDAIQDALRAYRVATTTWMSSQTKSELVRFWEQLNESFGEVQKAIGAELRRTPLDDLEPGRKQKGLGSRKT